MTTFDKAPDDGGISRLVRMLAVIGPTLQPDEMVDRMLAEMASVMGADLVCVAEVVDGRLLPTNSHGLPLGAAGTDWALGPTAEAAMRSGRATTQGPVAAADRPPVLSDQSDWAGAWVPLALGDSRTGDLLMLFRAGRQPFSPSDLEVVSAVALRMAGAREGLERNAAIERLAQAGPDLARHLDLGSMLDQAVELFRELTGTDSAFVVTIRDGAFEVASHTGTDDSVLRRFPRTFQTMPNWAQLSAGRPYVGPRETIPARPHETYASPTVLCVPVMRDGVAVALLAATGHRPRSFGKTSIDVATILANHLSAAMTNEELYRTLTEREHELERQAAQDPLTGLPNRITATRRIEDALAAGRGPVGLLFCDIDKFKAVNDRLGHEVGDELIQQVALRLATALGPNDLLARFGGDEFVFVLDGVRTLPDLTDVGERVQRSLTRPMLLKGEQLQVSSSVGAVLGHSGTTASLMLRNADAAMYVAKEKGPGRVEVFDDDASLRSVDRLDLRNELDRALERGQLSVVYQPLVQLKTLAIRSFEALVRWNHPERGIVPPDVFVPMAEETGAIVPIGAWVLAEASARLAEWRRLFPEADLTMGVNTSAGQLERSQPSLLDIITTAGADPRHMWLEVTERVDTSGDIADQVEALRQAGVHFALDDFGMVYSSLTYLQRFPVEGIKIDRSFVTPMTEDETQRGIVRAILALGESLAVTVVAEGIETQEQLDTLLDLGCSYGQGYLLAPPMTALECVRALRAQA